MADEETRALTTLSKAKAAHAKTGSDTTREALASAKADVRYVRWVARGGPENNSAERDYPEFYARWKKESK